MSKNTVISDVLALPDAAQREIFVLLQERWGGHEVALNARQLAELERRVEEFELHGSKGEKWAVVEKRLLKGRTNARPRHLAGCRKGSGRGHFIL